MRNLLIGLVCALSLTGCVGASTAAPPPPPPSVTPLPPLVAAPATLSFNSVGLTQPVTLTGGAPGIFSVSGCAGIATFNVTPADTFTVTSTGAGTCTFTFGDTDSHQATIAVSVTTLSVPVN